MLFTVSLVAFLLLIVGLVYVNIVERRRKTSPEQKAREDAEHDYEMHVW